MTTRAAVNFCSKLHLLQSASPPYTALLTLPCPRTVAANLPYLQPCLSPPAMTVQAYPAPSLLMRQAFRARLRHMRPMYGSR
jgi:hypothetical protein